MPSDMKHFPAFAKQIMSEPVWQDDSLFKLYYYCLSQASHNKYNWRGIRINSGDIPMSERHVSEALHWSRNKLDRKLKQLEEMNLIQIMCIPQKGTMVHVNQRFHDDCNTEETGSNAEPVFQNDTSFDETGSMTEPVLHNESSSPKTGFTANPVTFQNESSFESATASNWPHCEASLTKTGSMVEPNPYISNTKLYTHSIPREPEGFSQLWLAYPASRRTNKEEAVALFQKATNEGATVDAMIAALEADKSSYTWTKEGGRYIPGIVKWLQKETWHDYQVTAPVEEEEIWASR